MTPQDNQISSSNEMMPESFTIQDRINIIAELDKKLLEIAEQIKDKKWNNTKDSRILFIRYISELNTNTIFQLSFQAESHDKLADKNWLIERLPHLTEQINNISNIQKYSNNRNNNILMQIWDCFLLNYFYEFETRLRSIVRNIGIIRNLYKIKSKQNLYGNESFYLIYRGLYEYYLRFNKKDYEVLKIFSAIRNTIHNSGFCFPSDKKDKIFNYRNKTYNFKYYRKFNI